MSRYLGDFEEEIILKAIISCLYEGKSHRQIQREILGLPAPNRGGGFIAMDILHYYEIHGDKKGLLQRTDISKIIKDSSGNFNFLHTKYKPKSVKRKVASLKAFCGYLEEEGEIDLNPFSKIKISYKEPFHLPKAVSLDNINMILNTMYREMRNCDTKYKRGSALRNIAVIELLFATGMRVSELCSLSITDVDLTNKIIRIFGKGARERILQIEMRMF